MSSNSIVDGRTKHKTLRNAYKRIFGSCLSGDSPRDQYTAKIPSASYTHESILVEEIHKAEQLSREQKQFQSSTTSHDASLELIESNKSFSGELDRLSLANRNLSDQLQSVRNQLSLNLNRVRDFEERVKLIPKLQLELSVEKAENRDMHVKLQALEKVLKKKEQDEKTNSEIQSSMSLRECETQKPFNTQRVCATSLESLNIRFPSSSSPFEQQQSHKTVSKQSTHNVACMTTKSVMRDVGVVTIPLKNPTRDMSVNTDTIPVEKPKKPIMVNASCQSDREAKVQAKNVATETDSEPKPPQVTYKSTGIMATPNVRTNSCLARPEVRSVGTDNIYEKIRTRTVGTEPIKHLATDLSEQQSSPISLKSLNDIQTNRLKELCSVGTQHAPDVSDKFTQSKDKVSALTRTESTDTSDLTLHVHRGINTEVIAQKDRPIISDKSTSTQSSVKNSETNTDPYNTSVDDKCHNCLTKIEIKQRTIIKNPNKSQNIACLSSTTDSTYVDELQKETDSLSRIPRPKALVSPRSEKKLMRQNTYTVQCPAEVYLSSCTSSTTRPPVKPSSTEEQTSTHTLRDDETASQLNDASTSQNESIVAGTSSKQATQNEDDTPKLWSHSMKSSSTYSSLALRPRQKVEPSKEMQAALKVINDSLLKGQHLATTLKNANKIVQKEWFRVSSTENAQPFEVEDYLDYFEEYSTDLLKYMVNLTDANGNSAMHYAVSHGNFDIVSILLDSKVCNINNTNNAGYTCVMLVSLAKLDVAEHQTVVQRLFQMSDVNVRAKKHSQTALMLATSHGNYNMVRMLLDAGADINIQDEDGSTALMCAAEHGRMDIIKILLSQPDCDSTIQDLDGSTALKISLEAGYRDIGVLLYAHEYMIKNKSSLGNMGRKTSSSSFVFPPVHAPNSNIEDV